MKTVTKYNKNGKFLYRTGQNYIAAVSSVPQPTIISPKTEEQIIGNYKIATWFEGTNNHPAEMRDNYIKKSTVLQASIRYKTSLLIGQGVFAARIIGYAEDGKEILEFVKNPEVIKFLNSTVFKRYLQKAAYNLIAYGNLFPELIPNEPKNKIIGIYEKDAVVTRWGTMNDKNVIEYAYLSSNWTDIDENKLQQIPVLDYDQPLLDLQERIKKTDRIIYLNSMYDSQYYLVPDYESAIEAKWVDLALKTPKYLNASYDNALNILYHIKIPQEYFEFKFPESEYESHAERMTAIDEFYDELEKELTTVKNAKKAIQNTSVPGQDGKPLYWAVDIINAKDNFNKDILASDAADSQITNTFLINDAVFLKKGSGQGAGSGSDIREAHLINVSLAKPERDSIIEPLELIRDFNKWGEDIVFRFRDTVLTTLDSGKSTETIVT